MDAKRFVKIEDIACIRALKTMRYGITSTPYGDMIIRSQKGIFRMVDEPNYMDWQDRLEYSKQYRSNGKIYFQRRIR